MPNPPKPAAVRIPKPVNPDGTPLTIRLNKRMAELGLCSRREADAWIERGWVRVNGVPAVMGQPVATNARIEIDRQAEQQQRQQVTILLNKPVGYVSGQAEDGHEPAVVLVQPQNRLQTFPPLQSRVSSQDHTADPATGHAVPLAWQLDALMLAGGGSQHSSVAAHTMGIAAGPKGQ